jgi:hypothetical protein
MSDCEITTIELQTHTGTHTNTHFIELFVTELQPEVKVRDTWGSWGGRGGMQCYA